MDTLGGPSPEEVSPGDPRVRDLIETHLALMYEITPVKSVHAMNADALTTSGARFFAVFEGGEAVAMGALKSLGDGSRGEIKSMHVRAAMRGRGLADRILAHLLRVARDAGMTEVLLETGEGHHFAAARAFYARHGFAICAPFEGYTDDPESAFMRLALDP